MSKSQNQEIYGNRNLLEYFLSQNGFTPVRIKNLFPPSENVYEKGTTTVSVTSQEFFSREEIETLLEGTELSVDDFEDFVHKVKIREDIFDTIIKDCINVPPEEVKRAAKEWEYKQYNTEPFPDSVLQIIAQNSEQSANPPTKKQITPRK